MKVLFVCAANTCRSPMIEQMFKQYAFARDRKDIEVDSAGLLPNTCGTLLNPVCASVLEKHGVPYNAERAAKLCTKKDIASSDLVYAMDDDQAEFIKEQFGGRKKVKSLSELCGGPVPDPYGYDEEVYEKTYRIFNEVLGKIFEEATKKKGVFSFLSRKK